MKKYLITGALALVACATLTSCHSDDDLSGSLVEQKILAYEQVFEEEFGKVDPNQDWGFGTAEILARTRTAYAHTRADYANANMWADDWIIPQQLTPKQKLRVTRYFQTHKYPGSTPDYGNKNFFVQQVYDGATDPITNLDGFSAPAYSTEVYVPGNGEPINSGEHMDHLTAGPAVQGNGHHILNFNNATYGTDGTPNYDVSNSENVEYYEWDGWPKNKNFDNTHSDQIQLMLNHATYPWGYEDSSDSHLYTDCWTLVSAATIDAWADSDEAEALGIDLGDPVSTDGWNRSFIGFDFSLLVGDDIYEKVSYNSPEFKKATMDPYLNDGTIWVWDGNVAVKAVVGRNQDYSPQYGNGYDGYLYYNNKNVKVLISNLNNYCVDLLGYGNETADNKIYHNELNEAAYDNTKGATNDNCIYITGVKDANGNAIADENGNTNIHALNLKCINKLLEKGYLPVNNKKLFGKATGCRDGYYSDWIVSFMPAQPKNPGTIIIPTEPGSEGGDYKQDWYFKKTTLDEVASGRIFCEDLGVVRASDIDFNDIVLDVLIYKTEYITYHMISSDGEHWEYDTTNYPDGRHRVVNEADNTYNGDIWLLAGGGTIPAEISVPSAKKNWNVKSAFSAGLPSDEVLSDKFIVNTIESDEGRYGNQYRNDITPKKLNEDPLPITSVSQVEISVQYGSQFHTLTAYKGVAPHKICVPLDTKWLKEREEISNGYPHFEKYVKYQDKDGNPLDKYKDNPGTKLNDDPENPGYVGDGDPKESDERDTTYKENEYDEHAKSVWEDFNEAALYRIEKSYTYTPRQLSGVEEENGKGKKTGGGSNNGYQGTNTDPVLIRVRH